MNASQRYDRQANDSDSEVERDSKADPSSSNLDRAKAKLDFTAMLVERRLFHADMATDNCAAINIFSDGSPVTGAELQGMIVHYVKRDGSVRVSTLPGATLTYSHCGAVAKTLALVHSVYLTCGPDEAHLRYVFEGAQYHN